MKLFLTALCAAFVATPAFAGCEKCKEKEKQETIVAGCDKTKDKEKEAVVGCDKTKDKEKEAVAVA